jgi:membrane peptidoglycan carboxypeptidase
MNPSQAQTSDWWKFFAPKALSRAWKVPGQRWALEGLAVVFLTIIGIVEVRSAPIESHLFSSVDRHLRFRLKPGAGKLERPGAGPYDERLGFSRLSGFLTRLQQNQYKITAQARVPTLARVLAAVGLSGIYHEKSQAGLAITDRSGAPLFDASYPARIYPEFGSIPPLLVNTILFIENRQLLDDSHPQRNPAIEWARQGRAVIDLGIHTVDRKHSIIGGSTLATQLEKMRHSPGGRTGSVFEKARQVASASLRSYLYGVDTRESQRQIIRDYLNSMPLAATPAQGEVIGLGDGLKAWYGADFSKVNQLLSADEANLDRPATMERARAYREVLSLFLALRAPGWYLVGHPAQLRVQTDRYLRALADSRIISPGLRDLALASNLQPRPDSVEKETVNFVSNKAPDAIRAGLLPLLGLDNAYALDRLDLTVKTTLDKRAQDASTGFLESLSDPKNVAAANLNQYQLLDGGNPTKVIYSVTLYEQTGGVNQLRVQTDNFDQPLDINQGTRLQLGSTAKLRTIVHYLEIVATLHDRYATMSPEQLKTTPVISGDVLTAWAISYLSSAKDKSLEPMLEASLQRTYSGNPGEAFFTGGGLHSFANFESSENGQMFTVSNAFQHSVNLAFIRLLRDIEHYYRYRVPGASPDVLDNPDNPARMRYLARFADMEGREFEKRFYEKYRNQTADQALNTLISGVNLTPLRAAVIFRSVRPEAGRDKFNAFLAAHFPAQELANPKLGDLYAKYGIDKFNLQDRGYLARVHPLELWLLNYREHHPQATLAEIDAKSTNERQQVYQWLFKSHYKHAQDKRIETLLESDSFALITKEWRRLGYPFDSLVPSYATAIGVSGDTPAALSKLVGIILSGGVLYPTERIQQLHFGVATPFETILDRHIQPGSQVLLPQIAALVRQDMLGVVQNGTGRRAHDGIKLPDGTVLPIGGKTGTGDNEFHIYAKNGGLLATHTVNRTAAFTFFIGDRFFGTVLAFVPGKQAASYDFTSALAVQILKDLTPSFLPAIESAEPQHFTARPATSSPQKPPLRTQLAKPAPAKPAAVNPAPADAAPADAAPANAAPTNPAPTNPAPANPAPASSVPANPAPANAAPAGSAPASPTPANPAPANPAPANAAPTSPAPADPAPANAAPANAAPVNPAPASPAPQ